MIKRMGIRGTGSSSSGGGGSNKDRLAIQCLAKLRALKDQF